MSCGLRNEQMKDQLKEALIIMLLEEMKADLLTYKRVTATLVISNTILAAGLLAMIF